MKISTAIALGRALLKPVAGRWNDGEGGGCAWGMINAAAPSEYHSMCGRTIGIAIPLPCGCRGIIVGNEMGMESCIDGIWPLPQAIVHLFNFHVMTKQDWTMDQLIDWVASVEPPDPEEVTESVKEAAPCRPELVAHS